MADQKPLQPGTVPDQRQANPPLSKRLPLVLGLAVIVLLIGLANATSFVNGHKKAARASSLPMQPATANPQQVSSFETTQGLQAKHDDELLQAKQAAQQAQALDAGIPGPEADTAPPMTKAQKEAIYGTSANAPKQTSGATEAQAQAKQRQLARDKQQQDAVSSDTVAIDFERPSAVAQASSPETAKPEPPLGEPLQTASEQKSAGKETASPTGAYDFDAYDGQLYRVFEGTVFEGVVTNHIDGGFNGPMIVMLTTDYYSHDHQQLLLPQGTRLLGEVQSVGSAQQRKLFVVFNRAVCPDGFSLDLNKYLGLDPLGTTGLATKVDNHYLSSFAAAAAIGGLGGLAQIGNGASVLTSSAEIRNGVSEQSAQESEQILNHFLNRLPVITVKEGSRARVYINRDILIPSYAGHRVNPAL